MSLRSGPSSRLKGPKDLYPLPMAANDTLRLWRLAQIDNKLTEVRGRAATLDVGQKLAAEVKAVEAKHAEVDEDYHRLAGESKDLELTNAGIADKVRRIEAEMYSGKPSSREIENLNKEIAAQKRNRDANDDRLMALMEILPPAEETAKKWSRALDGAAQDARRAAGRGEGRAGRPGGRVQGSGDEAAGGREDRAARPSRPLRLDPAEARRRRDGRGERQGPLLHRLRHPPPRAHDPGLKDDKALVCETCHRLLYYTEGMV